MKQLATYKLKAGALQFVMYVVIVIAVMLSMLLLYTHLNYKFVAQNHSQIEAIKLAEEGMVRALYEDFDYTDSLVFDSDHQGFTTVRKAHWGIFDLVISTSSVRDKSFEKRALIGGSTPLDKDLALYIQDNHQALQLVGNTTIEGNAYVGTYGLKPGQISGQSFRNNRLVYGSIHKSDALPKIHFEKEYYLNHIDEQYFETEVNSEFFDLNRTKFLTISYSKPTQFFHSTEPIALFSKELKGNIVVQSDQQIYVDASSQLHDVILIAPEITIGSNFKGQLQAFATQNLKIESGVELDYPSALVLIPEVDENNKLLQLQIASGSKLKGTLAYLKSSDSGIDQNTFSHITIEEGSSIYGQIYSAYNLELKGDVYGHVITNQFITSYKGSLYINHLLDTRIKAQPVSGDFGGLLFNEKQIVSWVN